MMDLVKELLEVCLVPIVGALTTFLVQLINQKIKESKEKTNSEKARKYLDLLNATIVDCVIATNQTYVEELKKQGIFNAEAHKVAFTKTFTSVMDIIKGDAEEYLKTIVGDLDSLITEKIEATVVTVKK